MKKSILNLKGAHQLSKNEQIEVKGGYLPVIKCGTNSYSMTKEVCLEQVGYNPIWNPTTKKCSLVGPAC
jgi:hypothetical protein